MAGRGGKLRKRCDAGWAGAGDAEQVLALGLCAGSEERAAQPGQQQRRGSPGVQVSVAGMLSFR